MSFFNNSQVKVVTLYEWLDWASGNPPIKWTVELPMIQRGFVWKPSQIIELWDTVLQGLPIGALLVSELDTKTRSTPLAETEESNNSHQKAACIGRLGLIDGQQRTLAMMSGWPMPQNTKYSVRIWVDFADKPLGSELLRMRITTRNQPFGYSRDNPDSRLSLDERRAALKAWDAKHNLTNNGTMHGDASKPNTPPDFLKSYPYSKYTSLPLDLRELVRLWNLLNKDENVWKDEVISLLKKIDAPTENSVATHTPSMAWDLLEKSKQDLVEQRVNHLAIGLKHLHSAEIPLLLVGNHLFDDPAAETTEPLLALLFKRIGSNFTKLSNEDYIFAILKHLVPGLDEMVTALHGHRFGRGAIKPSVASLLSAPDLAVTALRLAAAEKKSQKYSQLGDPASPGKEEFHRLIKQKIGGNLFLNEVLQPLLKDGSMQRWFDLVLRCLEYREGADPGLPHHALPHLSKPLVQVMLRLAQVGYLGNLDAEIDIESRTDTLRLVLWWWLCVTDHLKASRIAYHEIAEWDKNSLSAPDQPKNLGKVIMQAIVKEFAGRKLYSPLSISARRPPLTISDNPDKVIGWSRFNPAPDDDEDRDICEFWRRWWVGSWSYKHPILLWLQRKYVHDMNGDPIAGRDEDTPYDYDHILPQNHWHWWTGKSAGTRFMDYCDGKNAQTVIGNSIGNIRVLKSSDNRSDGANAPALKLLLTFPPITSYPNAAERQQQRDGILRDSAIEKSQACTWFKLWLKSGRRNDHGDRDDRYWSLERAKTFERAVEQRALSLYESFFKEPDFSDWT